MLLSSKSVSSEIKPSHRVCVEMVVYFIKCLSGT